MDTRTKIVAPERAAEAAAAWRERGGKVLAATGHFDVLEAAMVCQLAAARGAGDGFLTIALPSHPPQPIHGLRARAEMAAALAVVDYVVITDSGPALEALLAALEPDAVVRLETADELRMRRLIDHVHRRHRRA